MSGGQEAVQATAIAGVVVGFDGSATARLALDWAADAAAAYASPLTLISARPDSAGDVVEVDAHDAGELLGEAMGDALDEAVSRVAARHADLDVRAVIHPDSPVDALLHASQTADLLVIGSRGLEGFRGLILGSTTMNVTPHAHCPVVVLYQPDEETEHAKAVARHPHEVVVGYDGSVSADLAISFALRHAEALGLGVAVVIVTKARRVGDRPAEPVTPETEGISEELRDLIREASAVVDTVPGVPVTFQHALGRPAGALIREAAGSPLAVVGARGRGGFAGLVLGSVGLQMLMHAECPVAVVHAIAAT